MKKLIRGILEFRQKSLPNYKKKFSDLADHQNPETLLIACSDSRVVPNLFASTDPGDLFVMRNAGNLVPTWPDLQKNPKGSSVGAVLEFAVKRLQVKDIIVCGHSDCGAMHALLGEKEISDCPHLLSWLELAAPSLEALKNNQAPDLSLSPSNQLSQINVLRQMETLKHFPFIREKLDQGQLALHAWWFHISTADIYVYFSEEKKFLILNETQAERLL